MGLFFKHGIKLCKGLREHAFLALLQRSRVEYQEKKNCNSCLVWSVLRSALIRFLTLGSFFKGKLFKISNPDLRATELPVQRTLKMHRTPMTRRSPGGNPTMARCHRAPLPGTRHIYNVHKFSPKFIYRDQRQDVALEMERN